MSPSRMASRGGKKPPLGGGLIGEYGWVPLDASTRI